MGETFKALVLDQVDDTFSAEFRDVAVDDLPEGDVTVAIEYSTINYKGCPSPLKLGHYF